MKNIDKYKPVLPVNKHAIADTIEIKKKNMAALLFLTFEIIDIKPTTHNNP